MTITIWRVIDLFKSGSPYITEDSSERMNIEYHVNPPVNGIGGGNVICPLCSSTDEYIKYIEQRLTGVPAWQTTT